MPDVDPRLESFMSCVSEAFAGFLSIVAGLSGWDLAPSQALGVASEAVWLGLAWLASCRQDNPRSIRLAMIASAGH